MLCLPPSGLPKCYPGGVAGVNTWRIQSKVVDYFSPLPPQPHITNNPAFQ